MFCVNDFSALSFIVCVLTYWIIKKYNRINEWANKILLNHKHKEKEEIIFVKERNMIMYCKKKKTITDRKKT